MMRGTRLLTLLLPAALSLQFCSCRVLRDQMDTLDQTIQTLEPQEPSERERMLAGETVLPPPRDVRVQREQESKQRKKDSGEDSALRLLAELCRRQDEYEQVQVLLRDEMARQEKERQAAELVKAEASNKRFSDLEQRLQNIEQQITALAQLMNHMAVRMPPPETPSDVQPPDAEPVPLQEPVIPAPPGTKAKVESEDPTQPQLPGPEIFRLPAAVAVAEETTAPEPAVTIAARQQRQPRTFSPDAQSLRSKAKRAFEWIIKEFPNTDELIDARLSLAQMALEDADINEALRQYESLIAERPEHPRSLEAYLEAGRLRSELGDYPAARNHLFDCADHQPDSRLAPLALLEAARTYECESAYGQALKGYSDVQNRFPDTTPGKEARCRRADLLLKLGRLAEARKLYAEIGSDKDPSNLERTHAWLQTARSFLDEKRPSDARHVLQEFMMEHLSDEEGGQALELFAQTSTGLNDSLDAARALSRVAEKYPTYSRVLETQVQAGEEYLSLELTGSAIDQFKKALKDLESAAPSRRAELEPKALVGLARAQRMDGRLPEALETLERLRKTSPANIQLADLEQAELMVVEKRYGEAAELLGRTANAYPGTALTSRALLRKAELEEDKVSPEDAVDTYLKLAAADLPPDAAALCGFRRAVCLMHLSREVEALQVLKDLVADEKTPPALVALARFQTALALERQGRLDDALTAYLDFADKAGVVAETVPEMQKLINAARWKVEKLQWLRGLTDSVSHADARTGNERP